MLYRGRNLRKSNDLFVKTTTTFCKQSAAAARLIPDHIYVHKISYSIISSILYYINKYSMHMYILALCTDTPVANWFVFLLFFLFFFSSHLLLVFSFFYYVICYFSYLLGLCHNYKTMRCCVITHTPRKPQRPQKWFFFSVFPWNINH